MSGSGEFPPLDAFVVVVSPHTDERSREAMHEALTELPYVVFVQTIKVDLKLEMP